MELKEIATESAKIEIIGKAHFDHINFIDRTDDIEEIKKHSFNDPKFIRRYLNTGEFRKFKLVEQIYSLATTEEARKLITEELTKMSAARSYIPKQNETTPDYMDYEKNAQEVSTKLDELEKDEKKLYDYCDDEVWAQSKLCDFAFKLTALMQTGDVVKAAKEMDYYYFVAISNNPEVNSLKRKHLNRYFEKIIPIVQANGKQVLNTNPELIHKIATSSNSSPINMDELRSEFEIESGSNLKK